MAVKEVFVGFILCIIWNVYGGRVYGYALHDWQKGQQLSSSQETDSATDTSDWLNLLTRMFKSANQKPPPTTRAVDWSRELADTRDTDKGEELWAVALELTQKCDQSATRKHGFVRAWCDLLESTCALRSQGQGQGDEGDIVAAAADRKMKRLEHFNICSHQCPAGDAGAYAACCAQLHSKRGRRDA